MSHQAQTPPPAQREVCLYLGRAGDPETYFLQPHDLHRCHATTPAAKIELAHQRAHCFSACEACPRYLAPVTPGRRANPRPLDPGAAGASLDSPVAGVTRGEAPRDAGPGDGSGDPRSAKAEAEASGLDAFLARLSFEEWVIYSVTTMLLFAIVYFAFFAGKGREQLAAELPERVAASATANALRDDLATPTPRPSATRRPTRQAGADPEAEAARSTAAVPTPPEGGLIAALSPSERGVGTFSEANRLPVFGDRELRVGNFNDQTYAAGLLFSTNKIPKSAQVRYVALELAGLSDSNTLNDGEWTVELLDPEAAEDWTNLTYEALLDAPAEQMKSAWRLPAVELAPRKINVLEFSDDALDLFAQRLEQGRLAFRIRGPGRTDADDLFIWDTGYGEGFGTRPVLRVAFVPPTPTPGPARDAQGAPQPTSLPLLVWISDPTPAPAAPTATPYPLGTYQQLQGMILFVSDRFKVPDGRRAPDKDFKRPSGLTEAEQLMVYDPATGRIGQVTQTWPYVLAERLQARAEDVIVSVGDKSQLVIQDRYTEHARDLTSREHDNYAPSVSPDGEWIAFTSNRDGNDEIYTLRRNGEELRRLTRNNWEWDKHPSFSPDGQRMVFYSNRDGRMQLYMMNRDGSDVRNISQNPYNDWNPIWVR